jgi:hypothetical protein
MVSVLVSSAVDRVFEPGVRVSVLVSSAVDRVLSTFHRNTTRYHHYRNKFCGLTKFL